MFDEQARANSPAELPGISLLGGTGGRAEGVATVRSADFTIQEAHHV